MTALCYPRVHRRAVACAVTPPTRTEPSSPRRIGLLGGSFNPAHDGHRYISVESLKRFDLDAVWWLVSPQNPLKPKAGMASLEERLAGAREVARHPRIEVLDLERRLGTRYTVDTLRRLAATPGTRFVWLIGADNLAQLSRWRHWRQILAACPIAVFARQPYSHAALASPAAVAFAGARRPASEARRLADVRPPAWTFIRLRPHPASATRLREGGRRSASVEGEPSTDR